LTQFIKQSRNYWRWEKNWKIYRWH